MIDCASAAPAPNERDIELFQEGKINLFPGILRYDMLESGYIHILNSYLVAAYDDAWLVAVNEQHNLRHRRISENPISRDV